MTKNNLLIMLMSFVGCSPIDPKANTERHEIRHVNRIDIATVDGGDLDDPEHTTGNYLLDYGFDLRFDTIIRISNNSVRLYQVTDTQTRITLPDKLQFTKNKLYIYNTTIEVYNIKNPDNKLLIGRSMFQECISDSSIYLLRYAEPLGISVSSIDSTINTVQITFSLSVPYSDLGHGTTICIDVSKMTTCGHSEY